MCAKLFYNIRKKDTNQLANKEIISVHKRKIVPISDCFTMRSKQWKVSTYECLVMFFSRKLRENRRVCRVVAQEGESH